MLLTIITHNAAAEGRLPAEWVHTPVASHCVEHRRAGALRSADDTRRAFNRNQSSPHTRPVSGDAYGGETHRCAGTQSGEM